MKFLWYLNALFIKLNIHRSTSVIGVHMDCWFCCGHFTWLNKYYDAGQEKKAAFLSPAEDKDSREVFSLIKKLNIVPDTRKKPKMSGKSYGTLIIIGVMIWCMLPSPLIFQRIINKFYFLGNSLFNCYHCSSAALSDMRLIGGNRTVSSKVS